MRLHSATPVATGISTGKQQAGFSLVELVTVAALLGIVAAAAIPALSPVSEKTLDTAASEVAAAIRFAQSEAMRTGQPYGVNASTFSQRVRVYWLDESGWFPMPNYSVYHPVDKKLYDLNFNTDPVLSDVTIGNAAFYYSGSPSSLVGFNQTGTPKTTGISGDSLLTSGSVTLSHKGGQRVISVEPITGRVTIQ